MTTPTAGHRVVVYSRVGCHLCEEAEALLARLLGDRSAFAVVDIDRDEGLRDRYTVRVPVVAVDGVEVAELAVDETALRLALRHAGVAHR